VSFFLPSRTTGGYISDVLALYFVLYYILAPAPTGLAAGISGRSGRISDFSTAAGHTKYFQPISAKSNKTSWLVII